MITHSPTYVGNYMKMNNCHFQKFSSLLFFNQKSLYLRDTSFKQGLNGVIKHESYINSSIVDDPEFNQINSTTFNDESFNNNIMFETSMKNSVFTIINCFFADIIFDEGLITVKKASFYLTESTFINCNGTSKTVCLDQSRCNTISHICCTNVTVNDGPSFVYGNGEKNDFFILLYSTIVGKSTDTHNGETSIYTQYGLQYHRCLNLTNLKTSKSIIQYQSPIIFSQKFITFDTIKDCHLMELSKSSTMNITCEMICAFNSIDCTKSLILINPENEKIDFTLIKCVFVNNNEKKIKLIDTNTNINNVLFAFIDCTFDETIDIDITGKTIQTPNVIITNASEITPLELPHYTKQGYCIGKPNKRISKKGCNAGACINETDCEDQIYFPSDAVQFTTIFHTEFYYPDPTDFFSESVYFSSSFDFTKSDRFSESGDFTKSSMFSQTDDFSKSNLFSLTTEFTKSSYFSETGEFTKSDFFSQTTDFTNSKKFSGSSCFTKTSFFSQTDDFSNSNKFLETNYFTRSNQFSNSGDFSKSNLFSQTISFTKSNQFSESNDFTKSAIFSQTSNFNHFLQTNNFTKSDSFTSSDHFSKSLTLIPHLQNNVTIIIPNSDSKSHALEIGIGVGAGGVGIIGAIIGFLIWKNRKPPLNISENETYELTEDTTNSIVTENDLNRMMDEDDPFAEEFEN